MTQIQAQKSQGHTVQICERSTVKMTGVSEVGNFSDTLLDIKTDMGTIILKGENLNITKLDTDSGELCISGMVTSMHYTKTKQKKQGIEGLFK